MGDSVGGGEFIGRLDWFVAGGAWRHSLVTQRVYAVAVFVDWQICLGFVEVILGIKLQAAF